QQAGQIVGRDQVTRLFVEHEFIFRNGGFIVLFPLKRVGQDYVQIHRVGPLLDSSSNDLNRLVVIFLIEVEVGQRPVPDRILRLRPDGRQKTLEGLIGRAARKLYRAEQYKGICIIGIFYQHGFQENYCLILLIGLQQRPHQRVHRLRGSWRGVVGILEGRDRLIVFVESDQGRSKNLIGRAAVATCSPDRLGDFLCPDPVLARQPNLGQPRQNLDVIRPPLVQLDQNILRAGSASSTLQEGGVFEADIRIEIGRSRRVRELLVGKFDQTAALIGGPQQRHQVGRARLIVESVEQIGNGRGQLCAC